MRIATIFATAVLALGLAAVDAEAAKRFGGGGNLGKQKAVPTNTAPASTPATPAAAPGAPAAAPAAAGAAGAAAAAKPSFMSRWGGLLAGLGIGALLASMFGASMGPIVGMLLAALLVGGLLFFIFRMFANRGAPAAMGGNPAAASATARTPFTGIGSGIPGAQPAAVADSAAPAAPSTPTGVTPDFDVPNFLRQAKTSFIRLQAASDAKDLDDIRAYTTPELYADIAMQLSERTEAARTEVVSVDARLVDLEQADGYDTASVRFTGLIREDNAANPGPFDEVWHVRKKTGERNPAWLIAGIQQMPE